MRRLSKGVLLLGGALAFLEPSGPALASSSDILYHDIEVHLHPSSHELQARDKLTVMAGGPGEFAFLLGRFFEVEKLVLDGKPIPVRTVATEDLDGLLVGRRGDAALEQVKGIQVYVKSKGEHILEVSYRGVVYDTLKIPEYSRGVIPEETSGIIAEEGVFLGASTCWYPDAPGDYSFFTLRVMTPPDFDSVTEGKRISRLTEGGVLRTQWEIGYPTKGIALVAGRYVVEEDELDGIKVMAYFFPSEKELIPTYVQAAKRYIDMYNNLIGPYPFSKFAIVENFFPTGFGMPSFTLLGRRVIRLPFIVYTSLGHEVAHNWWGNGVYTDYTRGNWCEGLTVYFADHRYKEAISDSAAADYRRTLDVDYTSYVRPDNDFPLSLFEERTTPSSRAVGYGKAAMVFHMLKKVVGEETFFRAMRSFYEKYQFREASWDDIRKTFERASGRELGFFFRQWIDGKGAPQISLRGARADSTVDGYEVRLILRQEPPFRLLVPVSISGADTACEEAVWFSSVESTFVFTVDFEPVSLRVDPRYDLFRRLDPFEVPPPISAVLGDKNALIILPTGALPEKLEAFDTLAGQLSRTGEGVARYDTAVTVADLKNSSMIILGDSLENAVLSVVGVPSGVRLGRGNFSICGESYELPGNSAYVTFRNPFNPEKAVCVIVGNSAEAVALSGYKITHYGKYSFVTFKDGKRTGAGIFPVEKNPLTYVFN